MRDRFTKFLAVGAVCVIPSIAVAQGRQPLPGWREVLPGKGVYAHPDSITKLSADRIRAVTYNMVFAPDIHYDDERIDCRTLWSSSRDGWRFTPRGKLVRHYVEKDTSWEKPSSNLNNARRKLLENVCAIARERGVLAR